jgi:hypothetical protein
MTSLVHLIFLALEQRWLELVSPPLHIFYDEVHLAY